MVRMITITMINNKDDNNYDNYNNYNLRTNKKPQRNIIWYNPLLKSKKKM